MTLLHVAPDRVAPRLPSEDGGSAGRLAGAVSGLLAAATAIAVGHLVAVLIAPAASPLLAVGSTFIDLTPEWLKSFAIRTFGSNDKIALLAGIAGVLAVVAVGIGLLGRRRLGLAVVAIGGFGLVGGVAALVRPGGSLISLVPAIAGSVSAMVVLVVLERAAAGQRDARPMQATESGAIRGSRRGFLAAAAATGVLIAVSGGLGVLVTARRSAGVAAAGGPAIPAPLEPAAAVPAGADLALDGVSSFITPNDAFYRVDTALQVPAIAPDDWRLRIHGMVDREVTLTLADLLAYPADRARHHADVRLQHGRRGLRRQRALDRGPAGHGPGAGRRPGRCRPDRLPLHRRHVDRHADRGRPGRSRRDAGRGDERRAAAGRPRLSRSG